MHVPIIAYIGDRNTKLSWNTISHFPGSYIFQRSYIRLLDVPEKRSKNCSTDVSKDTAVDCRTDISDGDTEPIRINPKHEADGNDLSTTTWHPSIIDEKR